MHIHKPTRLFGAAALVLPLLLAAQGAAFAQAADPLTAAARDAESELRQTFVNLQFEDFGPAPVKGPIYQATAGGRIIYYAPDSEHLLFAEIYDRNGQNLTALAQNAASAKKLAGIDTGMALAIGPADSWPRPSGRRGTDRRRPTRTPAPARTPATGAHLPGSSRRAPRGLDPRTAAFVLELTVRIVAEHKLTTMMVTHSMRQALDVGQRTVMLHQGRFVLDVSGKEREGLDVHHLLDMFEKVRGEKIDDDALLLG